MIRYFLFIILMLSPPAFAGSQCGDLFLGSRELVAATFSALDGVLPGRTVEEPTRIRRVTADGTLLGEMEFDILRIDGAPVLEVERLVIAPEYRRLGLSKLLLASVLRDYPMVTEIRSHGLALDNVQAFRAARLRGLDVRSAIMTTPAFRVRVSLGFGQIDDALSVFVDGENPKLNLVVRRR